MSAPRPVHSVHLLPDEPEDIDAAKLEEWRRAFARMGIQRYTEPGHPKLWHPPLRVVYTSPDVPPLRYEHDGDSGMKLHYLGETTHVLPGDAIAFDVGIKIAIPPGFEGQIRPRSSATRDGWLVPLGTVDASYRGELRVQARNVSGERLKLPRLHSIAQLVIAPVARVAVEQVTELDETTRGEGGFGSTGGGVR